MKISPCFEFLSIALFLLIACPAAKCLGADPREAQNGSWGDQGDGTYRNPILNADYPDVDVEQLGDTYYMISSKQHMCPGMVILESKDMVNWRTIGTFGTSSPGRRNTTGIV